MSTSELSLQTLPGGIALDGRTGEVLKNGFKINLPEQLFRLLALLGARVGDIVTREEIRRSLWSENLVNNVDDSINTAIRRLRQYLEGMVGAPLLIETVPGRGYRFVEPGAKPNTIPSLRENAPELGRCRLAALPFDHLSGNSEKKYFADSLTDAVITALAKIPALSVKPRCLVMGYKQLRMGLAATGRKLKVDAVLQGSVAYFDGRLRVTVQLLRVATEEHLWAESYIFSSGDILDFQMDVAGRISTHVAAKLVPTRESRPSYVPPIPIAHDAHLKAHQTFNAFTNEGFWNARRYWKEAIHHDPDYAQAFAGLAESYNMLGMTGLLHAKDALGEAQEAAKRAMEIDDSLTEAHAALAHTYMVEWNWKAAAQEFRQALQLDPNLTVGNPCHYVEFLMAAGEPDEAIKEIERIRSARPLANFLGNIVGWAYYGNRNYDRALRQHHNILKDDPKFGLTHVMLGLDYAQKKRYRTAIEHCGKVTSSGGTRIALNTLGYIYAAAGEKHCAKEILRELKRLLRTDYASCYACAAIYAGMGEVDLAFDFLNRACEVHDPGLLWLKWDPQLDNLRFDPRFQGLLNRMGLQAALPNGRPVATV
ncbi:MAG: winged helix-turn-helix domain-containing protein [Acidobacteriia bacterium]|nr:winged helix-turn-helix domain-containing protein [Terriglobia bacterium]